MTNELARVRVNWNECSSLADDKMPQFIAYFKKKTLEAGKQLAGVCTYVVGDRGSCPTYPNDPNYNIVEVYCERDGTGSDPDWWYCEPCLSHGVRGHRRADAALDGYRTRPCATRS